MGARKVVTFVPGESGYLARRAQTGDSVEEMPKKPRKPPNRRKLKKPMSVALDHDEAPTSRHRYQPPSKVTRALLQQVLRKPGHKVVAEKQLDLLRTGSEREAFVYYAGDSSLLDMPSVAIVGAREVSDAGKQRAYRLAKELVAQGVVIVSGLAKGVDTAAHKGAIQNNGRTIAVIGTPLTKAYPAENKLLQEEIYEQHLLLSPFAPEEAVFKGNFPKRNRVMALLSDATVIVEASDTSGSLHQAAECLRSDRWLFIMKTVAENPTLTWPQKFIGNPKVCILSNTEDIISRIR
jgi:DNA protecting protein DprA